jgi:hypothetical protein
MEAKHGFQSWRQGFPLDEIQALLVGMDMDVWLRPGKRTKVRQHRVMLTPDYRYLEWRYYSQRVKEEVSMRLDLDHVSMIERGVPAATRRAMARRRFKRKPKEARSICVVAKGRRFALHLECANEAERDLMLQAMETLVLFAHAQAKGRKLMASGKRHTMTPTQASAAATIAQAERRSTRVAITPQAPRGPAMSVVGEDLEEEEWPEGGSEESVHPYDMQGQRSRGETSVDGVGEDFDPEASSDEDD